ncbi:TPA: helix-turn-helix transcriptional regulator [Stenotrophomonas maltophilia]|jgi:prophage regulatory protein|uniref:AlpA family transcriptional regulator n=1 Tax=Stenotrophomonas riyadhensis TaxID=2859893 RepID=A0ABT2XCA9_9GAMM|nr:MULTISPECIES: AlpA family transcriptional regulator [Stenotrophomonas]AVO30002.1 AlpA family transcriptional regulator [Stenotrophomonas maltophilia]EKT4075429.1 AlpA family transcriptional regulator [Stenotrophomonas maltophilia]MBH1563539.1 AlpA family transcriptional regulator [Stenotrophomonas maltophilia]MBH1597018.1 AlpA family transcriptional regulator [Stenotrophomonas maltophilia]MBH1643948.1 AlpA family transcriptional regulator [Stenotrophomonas maltophilia]
MPRKTLLRLPGVEDKMGLRKSQIYALIKAGAFPPPVKLSERCSAWVESELDEWIESRIAASRKEASA